MVPNCKTRKTMYCPRIPEIVRSAIATVMVVLGVALPAHAQQDAAFQQYWKLEPQWCPAAVGRTPELAINAAFQTHATGFEDAGSTMYAGVDMAFQLGKTRHGVGAMFVNDVFGLFSQKRFAVQYAYHLKLWGGVFSLGTQLDLLSETIEGSKADLADGSDPAFPTTDLTGTAFDLGFGIYYARKQLQLGLSAGHLMAPVVTMGETNEYAMKRHMNFSGAYNIRLKSPLYTITPSVMFRTDFADYRTDITCRVQYEYEKRRMYGGVNYAPQRSVAIFFGGTLHGVDLCYSYEANTSGIGMEHGQHEVTIAYRMDLNLGKKGRNVHKSVRWL